MRGLIQQVRYFDCMLTIFWPCFDCILTIFWPYFDRILTVFWPYFLFLSLNHLKPQNFADFTNSSNCIRSTLLQISVMLNHLQSRHLTVFYDKTYFLDNCNGNGSLNPTFINMHFQNSFYLSKQTIAIVNNICHHII